MSKIFTGLVEEIGKVLEIKKSAKSIKLKVGCKKVIENAKIGDSIATNGACLTAVEVGNDYFVADIMPESVERTNLKRLNIGDRVNLEKSITLSTPLGGHLVTGDIDCEGVIKSIEKEDIAKIYTVEIEEKYMKYIVEKGRITIDGASLTVVSFIGNTFKVSIIPHTQEEVILGGNKTGDYVNIETDLIGKYVERMLGEYIGTSPVKKSKMDMKFLIDNGFA